MSISKFNSKIESFIWGIVYLFPILLLLFTVLSLETFTDYTTLTSSIQNVLGSFTNNFISDIIADIGTAFQLQGLFSNGSYLNITFTWFICVYFVRLFFEIVTFIPDLCRKLGSRLGGK